MQRLSKIIFFFQKASYTICWNAMSGHIPAIQVINHNTCYLRDLRPGQTLDFARPTTRVVRLVYCGLSRSRGEKTGSVLSYFFAGVWIVVDYPPGFYHMRTSELISDVRNLRFTNLAKLLGIVSLNVQHPEMCLVSIQTVSIWFNALFLSNYDLNEIFRVYTSVAHSCICGLYCGRISTTAVN